MFGEIASQYCDLIILTEDDPRDEDAKEIANEIKSGIHDTKNIYIEDRYDEVFMYREDGREPWLGDHVVARHCIRKYYLGVEDD